MNKTFTMTAFPPEEWEIIDRTTYRHNDFFKEQEEKIAYLVKVGYSHFSDGTTLDTLRWMPQTAYYKAVNHE